MYTHIYLYTHIYSISEKVALNLKAKKEEYIRGFIWRKGKGVMIELHYNLKKIKEIII